MQNSSDQPFTAAEMANARREADQIRAELGLTDVAPGDAPAVIDRATSTEAEARVAELEEQTLMLRAMLDEAFDEYIGQGEEPVSLHKSFATLRDRESKRRPMSGAELAAKHGFEPIPDWKKDPFVRPMRTADSVTENQDSTQTGEHVRPDNSACGSSGLVQPRSPRPANASGTGTGHAVTTTGGAGAGPNDSQGEVVPALAPNDQRSSNPCPARYNENRSCCLEEGHDGVHVSAAEAEIKRRIRNRMAKLEPWDLWALENDYEDDYDPGCECGGCLFIRKYLDDRRSDSPKASDE